jgi:hypothetical protein
MEDFTPPNVGARFKNGSVAHPFSQMPGPSTMNSKKKN